MQQEYQEKGCGKRECYFCWDTWSEMETRDPRKKKLKIRERKPEIREQKPEIEIHIHVIVAHVPLMFLSLEGQFV